MFAVNLALVVAHPFLFTLLSTGREEVRRGPAVGGRFESVDTPRSFR